MKEAEDKKGPPPLAYLAGAALIGALALYGVGKAILALEREREQGPNRSC